MFKLISMTSGVVLTLTSVYVAQKKINESLKDDEELRDMLPAARLVTSFATTVIVGGLVNKIIQSVFK